MTHPLHEFRTARSEDLLQITTLWHEGWHRAHAHLVPKELTDLRTLSSFHERVERALSDIVVAEHSGRIVGFCTIKNDELDQLFIASQAKGSGLAQSLVENAEARVAKAGAHRIWLKCAIGNDRAAALYRKCGWDLARIVVDTLETSQGPFPLEVWVFEKTLEL